MHHLLNVSSKDTNGLHGLPFLTAVVTFLTLSLKNKVPNVSQLTLILQHCAKSNLMIDGCFSFF